MRRKTNLRALRHQYKIPLSELAEVSALSNQYISRAELGELSPTVRLEKKLGAAVDAVIERRTAQLAALQRSYGACKGRLLQLEEGDLSE